MTSTAAEIEQFRPGFEAWARDEYQNLGGEFAGPGDTGWYYWDDETAAAWAGYAQAKLEASTEQSSTSTLRERYSAYVASCKERNIIPCDFGSFARDPGPWGSTSTSQGTENQAAARSDDCAECEGTCYCPEWRDFLSGLPALPFDDSLRANKITISVGDLSDAIREYGAACVKAATRCRAEGGNTSNEAAVQTAPETAETRMDAGSEVLVEGNSGAAPGDALDARWVDLKHRKPPEWKQVLVALDNGTVTVGMRGSMGWHWDETDEPTDGEASATHWQLWPEAPGSSAIAASTTQEKKP